MSLTSIAYSFAKDARSKQKYKPITKQLALGKNQGLSYQADPGSYNVDAKYQNVRAKSPEWK